VDKPNVASNAAPPKSFRIDGMCCGEECSLLRRIVGPLAGGAENLAFDILERKMTILAPPAGLTNEAVMKSVAATGMKAVSVEEHPSGAGDHGHDHGDAKGRRVAAILSGVLLCAGFVWHWFSTGNLLAALHGGEESASAGLPFASIVLYGLAAVSGGWFVFPRAWLAVRRLRPDMHLLMTLAAVGAAILGDWFEAGAVTFLFGVSLALEDWSVQRARHAVAALLKLTPQQARVVFGTGEAYLAPEEVRVGSIVSVKPGERFPLDGVVKSGSSEVLKSLARRSSPAP
jgi:Cd2+/Zn2+-exporting ATPase